MLYGADVAKQINTVRPEYQFWSFKLFGTHNLSDLKG